MQMISNPNPTKISAILAWTILLTIVTPPVEGSERHETEQLTVQQCSIENNGQMLLIHGRHHRHRHYHPHLPILSPLFSIIPPSIHRIIYIRILCPVSVVTISFSAT